MCYSDKINRSANVVSAKKSFRQIGQQQSADKLQFVTWSCCQKTPKTPKTSKKALFVIQAAKIDNYLEFSNFCQFKIYFFEIFVSQAVKETLCTMFFDVFSHL